MARNQASVDCAAGSWTQLTNADADNITFQVTSGNVFIRFTTDATTPTEARGQMYQLRDGKVNAALSTLTTLSGAKRVWAKPTIEDRNAIVYVDHADAA